MILYLFICDRGLFELICGMSSIVTTDSNQAMVRAQILNEASGVYSDREFSFDAHYGPMATQSELYQRPAALVESVLNGCNATVFAYGQVVQSPITSQPNNIIHKIFIQYTTL